MYLAIDPNGRLSSLYIPEEIINPESTMNV